jgi:hypothetical protein
MGYDIFGLRIVRINRCSWNWNVFIVMEVLVKIYVNGLWYIRIKNCDNKWMLLKLECIDGYGIVCKKIYVNELWYIWIENCDDKLILLKLEYIDGYGIVGKNICEWVMIYLDWELWW